MWIHKVIIFLFLYIESKKCFKTENHRFKKVSDRNDLLLVYNDLAILSRIINAISIQSSVIQNTVDIREIITELLHVHAKNFSLIVKNEIAHHLPILEDLEKRATSLGNSVTADERTALTVVDGLNQDLGYMKEKIDFLPNKMDFEAFFGFMKEPSNAGKVMACESETVIATKKFSGLLRRGKTTRLTENDSKKIIKDIISKTLFLKNCLDNFKNYKKDVSKPLLDSMYPVAGLVMVLNDTEEFRKDEKDLKTFVQKIKIVEKMLSKVYDSMKDQKTSGVGAMLSRGVSNLKKISDTENVSPKSLTVGFQNAHDLIKVSKDLKSGYFNDKIAKGKSLNELEKNLEWFFKFGELMMKLEDSWLKFDKMLSNSENVLKKTANKVDITETHKKVNNTFFNEYVNKYKSCEQPSNYDKSKYRNWDLFLAYCNNIKSKIRKIGGWMDKTISSIDPDRIKKFIDSLKSLDTSGSVKEILEDIKQLDDYDIFFKFGEQFGELKKVQEDVGKLFDTNEVNTAYYNIDGILKVFEESNSYIVSKCLSNHREFESETMKSVVEYIKSALDIDHFHQTKELFRQFLKMRNDLMTVEKHMNELRANGKSSKHNLIIKLNKSKEIALSFARGVNMIHNMALAFQNQNLFLEATKYDEEVNESILKSNNDEFVKKVWINPAEPINKFLDDLKNLNQFAGTVKNEDLIKMKEIFQNAKKVKGFPNVFSSIYAQLVKYQYKDNKKLRNVKNAKELSQLDLDFSAHKGYLPAASLSIGIIKSYFDDIFGLSSKTKKKISRNAYGVVVGISVAVFFIMVTVFLTAYGFTKGGKKKYKKLYLYYFPKSKEFEKRWRYSLFMDRDDGKNALLDAVREINATNVLKAVKKGGYINVYNKCGNTALHVATKRGYPEIVDILIKHGANRDLLNVDNKTPEQMIPPNYRETHKEKIQRFEKVEKIYKKYQKKTFRIQVPNVFPSTSFHIYVEGRTNDLLTNSFTDKFQSIASEEILSTTTHCIVKTEKEGYLETDDLKILVWIFTGVIIVKDTWMIDCLKNESLIDKDEDYLVENIKYNGVMYNTIIQWTNALAKGTVPYLYGIYVAVVIMGYENIAILSNIVATNGGVMLDKFPEKEDYNIGSCPYLHKNTSPLFIIHNGTVDLNIYKNDKDKMYTLFTEEEFIGFMLKRDIQINTNPNPITVAVDPTIE